MHMIDVMKQLVGFCARECNHAAQTNIAQICPHRLAGGNFCSIIELEARQ